MMPIPNEYQELLKDLLAKTKAGKVEWRESPTGGKFYLAFSRFALEILSGGDEQAGYFVRVVLRNEDGVGIDEFDVYGGPEYATLEELHGLAQRKARKIDEALAELKAELDSEAPGADFPPPPSGVPF
jgi:hypothetical protein